MNLMEDLKNPRSSVYKVFEVLKHPMPRPLAALLGAGNRPSLPGVLRLPTYDGSGQACHPTVSVFQGKTFMACTPYPYGQDFYENPCL